MWKVPDDLSLDLASDFQFHSEWFDVIHQRILRQNAPSRLGHSAQLLSSYRFSMYYCEVIDPANSLDPKELFAKEYCIAVPSRFTPSWLDGGFFSP